MQKRILIVSQEISPYTESELGKTVLDLVNVIKKNKGSEIRLFMPKYGCVNERRHQLHEVIRLSGVNIVVDDIDQPLIVKVASIPQARLQVYFIDNDEYFQKKIILHEKNDSLAKDNDERMIFFCRGVLETLQMLGWSPDVIHCHGWFTSLLPLYLKKIYAGHNIFSGTKILSSIYKNSFENSLNQRLIDKINFDGIETGNLNLLQNPTNIALNQMAALFSDGIILPEESDCTRSVLDLVYREGKPVLSSGDFSEYYNFYQNFFSEELV